MTHPHRRPLTHLGALVVLFALVGLLLTSANPSAATPQGQSQVSSSATKPTIVLVHGAWADASGWTAQLQALRAKGYEAIALANPLRGLTSDAAYVRSVLDTISGPIVLVGHSYGGAVISSAAAGSDKVKALVYVAAFVPDEGESVGLLARLNPGSLVTDGALLARPFPAAGGGTDVDLYLRPENFSRAFAADVPPETARLMWATQRPLAASAFSEPAGAAAWRTIPSWYLLATEDKTIPPKTQEYMAGRADAITVRVRASHVAMVSRPTAATNLILAAARTVS